MEEKASLLFFLLLGEPGSVELLPTLRHQKGEDLIQTFSVSNKE